MHEVTHVLQPECRDRIFSVVLFVAVLFCFVLLPLRLELSDTCAGWETWWEMETFVSKCGPRIQLRGCYPRLSFALHLRVLLFQRRCVSCPLQTQVLVDMEAVEREGVVLWHFRVPATLIFLLIPSEYKITG